MNSLLNEYHIFLPNISWIDYYVSIFWKLLFQDHKLISSETTYLALNSRLFKVSKYPFYFDSSNCIFVEFGACVCAFVNIVYAHVRMLCANWNVYLRSFQLLIHVYSYELDVWFCKWSTWRVVVVFISQRQWWQRGWQFFNICFWW